jgi:hypothetical protein
MLLLFGLKAIFPRKCPGGNWIFVRNLFVCASITETLFELTIYILPLIGLKAISDGLGPT